MRHFHSYGPVDPRFHFAVERRDLVEQCVNHLVGEPGEGGHFFTIWAPRQTGKTWLKERAIEETRARHGERFIVGTFSMGLATMRDDEPDEAFFTRVAWLFDLAFGRKIPPPATWQDLMDVFRPGSELFDRPVILLIDEFDDLPRTVIDRLVRLFREIYLDRQGFLLHGLALIGVRAVLGVESDRGSPFNIQRALHVPNLTEAEVAELFDQYRAESGQVVEPDVVSGVFTSTRGQPGLVGWFGELLTEKYNPGKGLPVTLELWRNVYEAARTIEWNNTILNLIKKARGPYGEQVVTLFTDPNVPFSLRIDSV